MNTTLRTGCSLLLGLFLGSVGAQPLLAGNGDDRIQPYPPNSFYWQYHGKPILLLGGTDDDNLFQWTGAKLIEQLDLLTSVGGNYVRNTMSSRDEANLWPYEAYCLAEADKQYAVYFPNKGSVILDTARASTPLSVRWYNVDRGQWRPEETAQANGSAELTTPEPGQWAVVILGR